MATIRGPDGRDRAAARGRIGERPARRRGAARLGCRGRTGAAIVAYPEAPIGSDQAARFASALDRRAAGEPVAYIRGLKEFHGLAFGVDRRALIPRPETEAIVDAAIGEVMRRLAERPGEAGAGPAGAAIRSGSPTSGPAAGRSRWPWPSRSASRRVTMGRNVTILATDASEDALDLARENAVGHGAADGMRFVEADLLPVVLPDDGAPFDLVLANLPYVRTDAIDGLPIAASFEPGRRWTAGRTGWT